MIETTGARDLTSAVRQPLFGDAIPHVLIVDDAAQEVARSKPESALS
jgi:hypothetical protein